MLVSIWLLPAVAWSQPARVGAAATTGTVSGTGTVVIKRRASVLVTNVQLFGRGKTLKEALGNLKDRREAAQLQLETLQADSDSIQFGDPTLSNVFSKRRSQFEQMIKQRMRGRAGKVPKGLQIPRSYVVSSLLTARWPLQAENVEDLLLEAEKLTEKIKSADLAGTKDAEKLSPEEEELAEELAEMSGRYSDEKVAPGTPRFHYEAKISDQQHDKAMAEAFEKARAHAARLANAAGKQLGPLANIAGQHRGAALYDDYGYDDMGFGNSRYQYQLMQRAMRSAEGQENTSFAPEPGMVTFTFRVMANFYIK